ncbi:MAG: dihydrolipoyl dehydrogenase [Thermoguttaceae bacterium]
MTREYDIAVIGGGPAGYVAAIRSAQLGGASICLIEAEQVGGTCLNHGCIPTKTLLHNVELLRSLAIMSKRGIRIADQSVSVDMPAIMRYKDGVVRKLVLGVAALLKSYEIEYISGMAQIHSGHLISVNNVSENSISPNSTSPNSISPNSISPNSASPNSTTTINGEQIHAKKIIVAGGSKAILPQIEGIFHPNVLTNREILKLNVLPKRLIIIGGGVIGIEMARIFSAFGTEVTILEWANHILPSFDWELSKEVVTQLKKDKVTIRCGVKVVKIEEISDGLCVHDSEQNQSISDYVLVSTGRTANLSAVSGLSLKQERGFLCVNEFMQTSDHDIYAPGDINGRSMLAHAAFKMAEIAAEHAAGQIPHYSISSIPQVLYGHPEVASVGLTESDALGQGIAVQVGKYPFLANGRAVSTGDTSGFVKVVASSETTKILGVQIVGASASELINEAAAILSVEMTANQLSKSVHGHPTFSEALMEAAADAVSCCCHLPKKPTN